MNSFCYCKNLFKKKKYPKLTWKKWNWDLEFFFFYQIAKKNVKVNSLTPVSDQDNLSLQYLYNIIQASDENKDKYQWEY